MDIAFYAPLKPPNHPIASGDRTIARLFLQAMERAGHKPFLASELRSREPEGNPEAQARMKAKGKAEAERILESIQAGKLPKPEIWLTYHLYYKAPDWIGPEVSRSLEIPYIVAEASLAPKRAGGPWDISHRAVLEALEQATLILPFNPANAACLPHPEKQRKLLPFLDLEDLQAASKPQGELARLCATPPRLDRPWMVSVAMMRPGDKFRSFEVLAKALELIKEQDWALLIVGDGPCRKEVEALFSPFEPGRVAFFGFMERKAYLSLLAACDLFVWPAVREAFGMALLEAQAMGLPVCAGREGGLPRLIREGETGLLSQPGQADDLAMTLLDLLKDPQRRKKMGKAAASRIAEAHSLAAASKCLDGYFHEAVRLCRS